VEKSFVAGGACQSCKPWQQVHLASIQAGGSRCEDICPMGSVFADPNAPAGTPKVSASSPGAPQSAGQLMIPGQGSSAKPGQPGNVAATSSGIGLGGSGGGGKKAPTALPGSGGGGSAGEKLSGKAALPPMCVPCGRNEYVENNQCHDCGSKAVVNVAARTCIPCAQGQVAKSMTVPMIKPDSASTESPGFQTVLTCAADCSKVGGTRTARPSTNYITDPNDKNHCIPCKVGSKPNDTHSECLVVAARSTSPEKETFTAKSVPALPPDPSDRRKKANDTVKATTAKIKLKDEPKGTIAKINCPPGRHPNPRGTGCLPDLDTSDFGIGSRPGPGGGLRTGGGAAPGGSFGIMVPRGR